MREFYLLLDDSTSFLLLDDAESYLIIATEDDANGGDGEYYHNLRIAEANLRITEAKRREKIKQDEVIRLKLEAQEILLKQREVRPNKDKQSKRQLAALEKEYAVLQKEIEAHMQALQILHENTVKQKNNVLILLLAASCPLTSFTIH